jgi:hypothetical protein
LKLIRGYLDKNRLVTLVSGIYRATLSRFFLFLFFLVGGASREAILTIIKRATGSYIGCYQGLVLFLPEDLGAVL